MIDAATTLGKVDILSTAVLSVAATSLLLKPFNTAGFYLVVNSLVDNSDIYIEDSDFIIAEFLNTL